MKKFIGELNAKKLSRKELKTISGGNEQFEEDCGSGTFSCTCNGVSYGCVSSIQECWNKY